MWSLKRTRIFTLTCYSFCIFFMKWLSRDPHLLKDEAILDLIQSNDLNSLWNWNCPQHDHKLYIFSYEALMKALLELVCSSHMSFITWIYCYNEHEISAITVLTSEPICYQGSPIQQSYSCSPSKREKPWVWSSFEKTSYQELVSSSYIKSPFWKLGWNFWNLLFPSQKFWEILR